MRKAFIITAHKAAPALIYTVEYLSRYDENLIIIHYDAKSNISDIKHLCNHNVIILPDDKRIDIRWGSPSQIYATVNLLKEAIKHDFDYCFFISGDDIPVKNNKDMNNFLARVDKDVMADFQDERSVYVNPEDRVMYRYTSRHYNKSKNLLDKIFVRMHKLLKKRFFKNRMYMNQVSNGTFPKLYKGTNWFTISNKAARYIVNFVDKNPCYTECFKQSYLADEVFFHSILKTGSEHLTFYSDKKSYSDCLRYVDWETGPDHPRTLDGTDYKRIKEENGVLFARKYTNINKELFDKFTA